MKIGNKFLKIRKGEIVYQGNFLYLPKNFNQLPYSDLLWMAKKIMRVTRTEIEEILRTVNWPDFVQKVAVCKLLKRRNQIAHIFKLEEKLDEKAIPDLNISIDMHDTLLLENELHISKSDLLNMKQQNSNAAYDQVVIDGQLVSCKKSIIIKNLESTDSPEGITRKQRRRNDKYALPKCDFSNH